MRLLLVALWCAFALKGVSSQSTPVWISTSLKVAPTSQALSMIPPTSTWPFVVSSYMATCGAPWYANNTIVSGPCPHILPYNDTELNPRWPEPPSSLSALFAQSGLSHLLQDAEVMDEIGSRISPRPLMALVLLSCEQFYVQWIVNATQGRYPPPRGMWDPRCACSDALDYTMSLGIIRHYNTLFQTPLGTMDNPRGIDFLGPLWYDVSNFTVAQLGGQPFKNFWQKMASVNSTTPLMQPRAVWRYTREPMECRVDSRVTPDSQFTVPQTSTRSPFFMCSYNPFGQGPQWVWGTEEYIACHQKDTWDWFWSIPPETLSSRPAEYSLLHIVEPPRPAPVPISRVPVALSSPTTSAPLALASSCSMLHLSTLFVAFISIMSIIVL